MKKIIGLLIVLFCLVPILTWPNSVKANYNIDNRCNYVDTAHEDVNGGGGYYQTFYAKENRLTSAVLTLGALAVDATATLKIMTAEGNQLASQALTVAGANPVVPAPYSFDNFSPITVTAGQMYKLVLLRSAGPSLYWYKTTVCDVSGNGYVDGASFPGMDYVFTTYGYTENTPTPTPTTGIAAPTSVAAEYVTATSKVKITWNKSSTTDIDGYRIFRSEQKTEDFTKVGTVDKGIYEYSDSEISASKTYYYYVRAYKGSDESENSNTATVTIPAKKTTPATTAAKSASSWWLYAILGGSAALLIAFLIVYEIKLKKMWAKPKEGKEKKENPPAGGAK